MLGLVTLVRRSQTLGGLVPLRVAQACVPLLEGNAWCYQIALGKRIELCKRLGRWSDFNRQNHCERGSPA